MNCVNEENMTEEKLETESEVKVDTSIEVIAVTENKADIQVDCKTVTESNCEGQTMKENEEAAPTESDSHGVTEDGATEDGVTVSVNNKTEELNSSPGKLDQEANFYPFMLQNASLM